MCCSSYKNHDQLIRSAMARIDDNEGWMTKYNVRHSFSSPWRVRQTMQSLGIGDYYLSGLTTFKDTFSQARRITCQFGIELGFLIELLTPFYTTVFWGSHPPFSLSNLQSSGID